MGGRTLVVSDLDGTLLGDDEALERFAAWLEPRRSDTLLAYASGRFYSSVIESIETSSLPEPNAVIGGVGSEICDFPSGANIWSPSEIVDDNWSSENIQAALRGIHGIRLQPDEFQSPYKISFYLDDADARHLRDVRSCLHDASIDADIIYSSQRDLDVLPAGVNKGSAVDRLVERMIIEQANVFVCGDSGNDRCMLDRGYCGVVVGNAHADLRALTGDCVYHAQASYAAGVLEGIEYWLEQRKRHAAS